MVCFQECLDQFVLVSGSLSKLKLARKVVQAVAELLEDPLNGEFFEMPVNAVGPREKVFPAVDTSRAEMSFQLF